MFLMNHSCCLQKQMKTELQVKRLYKKSISPCQADPLHGLVASSIWLSPITMVTVYNVTMVTLSGGSPAWTGCCDTHAAAAAVTMATASTAAVSMATAPMATAGPGRGAPRTTPSALTQGDRCRRRCDRSNQEGK